MIDLRLEDNNDLVARLRSGELDVATISSAIGKDYEREKVKKQFSELSIGELEALGLDVIEFLSFIATFTSESEPLKKIVLELKGEDYAQQLERARLAAWQGFMSRDYSTIKGIQALLEEHKDCDLREWELKDWYLFSSLAEVC